MSNKFQRAVKKEANRLFEAECDRIAQIETEPILRVLQFVEINYDKLFKKARKTIRKGPRL